MSAHAAMVPGEKPQNGIAGIRHWRQDIVAGLLVSLVSLPLSLGIAIASGAPPIAGLTSAIIAGIMMPLLGGSFVTISGPAAGLAPALLAIMTTLGAGDLQKGYPLLLVVICLTGVVQLTLSKLRAARLCAVFPTTVVEGMLASIGFLIIAKQLPYMIGHKYKAHEFFEYILETPEELRFLNPKVFGLGMFCLCLLFFLSSLKSRWVRLVPPQLIVVIAGIILGQVIQIDPQYLIHLPENPLAHGLVLPNFQGILAAHELWRPVLVGVLTLTMIDGVESLATAMAIDKIDPYQRKSDPDRTLFSMGVMNICSSLAGGLTIIPGGVKSKVCIVAGGRTLWANFYNAFFLVCFLLIGRNLINLIPYSALAAVLMFTGYKMCEPKLWRHIAHVGREQLLLFTATVLITLYTDLLIGIFAGVGIKLLMNATIATRAKAGNSQDRPFFPNPALVIDQFRNPVSGRELTDGTYKLTFDKPIVCFNLIQVNREFASVPREAKAVELHITGDVPLIDHTSCENLLHFVEQVEAGGSRHATLVGLDAMHSVAHHTSSMRLAGGVFHDGGTLLEPANLTDPFTIGQAVASLKTLGLFELDREELLPFSPLAFASLEPARPRPRRVRDDLARMALMDTED